MGASVKMSANAVVSTGATPDEDVEENRAFKVAKILLDWSSITMRKTGTVGWVVGTSLMVLVVPAVMNIMRQQEAISMQQEMAEYSNWKQQQAGTGAGSVLDAASLGN